MRIVIKSNLLYPLLLTFLLQCSFANLGLGQKKVKLEDESNAETLILHENPSASYLTLGGNKRIASLTLDASDEAGAPAAVSRINIKGYEGRGKGIYITDYNYDDKWFIGEGYNYQGIGIGYSTIGQTEYRDNVKFVVSNNGYVGINKFNPSRQFEVNGNSLFSGTQELASLNAVQIIRNTENTANTTAFTYYGDSDAGDLNNSFRIGYDNQDFKISFAAGSGTEGDFTDFMNIDGGTGRLNYFSNALIGDGTSGIPSDKSIISRSASDSDGFGAYKHGGVGSTTGYFMSVDNASAKSWKGGIIFEKTASSGRGDIHICNNDTGSQEDVTLEDKVITINRDKSTDFHDAVNVAGRMEVKDIIKTTEVQVQPTPWPDYVFAPSYQLAPLSEVEEHIEEHGHLENIPSQAEVEENGIALGEMNAKLLEKIEELTLYLIEQNKLIQNQSEKIDAQSNKMLALEKEILKLKISSNDK